LDTNVRIAYQNVGNRTEIHIMTESGLNVC